MDVPQSCQTTKSRTMAPMLRTQGKTVTQPARVRAARSDAASAWPASSGASGAICGSSTTSGSSTIVVATGGVRSRVTGVVGPPSTKGAVTGSTGAVTGSTGAVTGAVTTGSTGGGEGA